MEQQPGPQQLSAVINVPTIAGFLAGDPAHVAILDTLLDLPLTGVDSEIRTEVENGTVVSFPVLTLCLEGLESLLDKDEIAKQILQEKINSKGGQSSIHRSLIQNFPIARTGFLSARSVSDELDSIKMNLEAAYNEKLKRIKAEHAQKLDEVKRAVEIAAAEELSRYKKDAYNEAKKAAATAMANEFERLDKLREQEATTLKAKAKEEIAQTRDGTLTTLRSALEAQRKLHNASYKARLKKNAASFASFRDKWYIGVTLDDRSFARMTYRTAAKLISEDPTMFNTYKGLCLQAVRKYKQELKDQYRAHLHDIELECRQWLKDNASGRLGLNGAADGLQHTLFEARAWDPASILSPGRKEKMQSPTIYMTQDALEEEAREINAEFHFLQEKDVSEGGLGLQPVRFQNDLFEAAIQEADAALDIEMQTVLGTLDELVATRASLNSGLEASQERDDARIFSNEVEQAKPQFEVGRLITDSIGLQPEVDLSRSSRDEGIAQAGLQTEVDSLQMASNDVVQPEMQVDGFEVLDGFEPAQLQPFKSPPSNERLRKLQRVFHGKTVTEIFTILGKRKRDTVDFGNRNVKFGTRVDQKEH